MIKKSIKFYRLLILIFLLIFVFSIVNLYSDPIRYAEQFYRLYTRGAAEISHNIERNIYYLKMALVAPFAPVVQALCIITTQEQYIRYKYLFKMHVNYLLMRAYLQYGARWDKENIYFYNYLYKEYILESLKYAEFYYKTALYYWNETLKYRKLAEKFEKFRVPMPTWEDEYYLIKYGYMDYKKIIEKRLNRVIANINYIKSWEKKLNSKNSQN